jgi:hypothetical protein
MIKDSRFVLSRRPYAADLGSLSTSETANSSNVLASVRAVWFRRRRSRYGTGTMRTVASIGTLQEYQPPPRDAEHALEQMADGSWGGRCEARWDGETLWAPEATEDQRKEFLAVLEPMLANYPEIPKGFDGWWHFPRH